MTKALRRTAYFQWWIMPQCGYTLKKCYFLRLSVIQSLRMKWYISSHLSVNYSPVLACMLSHFSSILLLATLWAVAHRLLLCPWDSPGKNTRVGYHALRQGIFLKQELNSCLLHCRWILYLLSHLEGPSQEWVIHKWGYSIIAQNGLISYGYCRDITFTHGVYLSLNHLVLSIIHENVQLVSLTL